MQVARMQDMFFFPKAFNGCLGAISRLQGMSGVLFWCFQSNEFVAGGNQDFERREGAALEPRSLTLATPTATEEEIRNTGQYVYLSIVRELPGRTKLRPK